MSVTDAERLDVKFFVERGAAVDVKAFMSIFQRWIQEDRLPGLLLDVADYTHVPDGPGMVLVAHEGQYVMDASGGRLGLLYSHRRGVGGGIDARILEAFRRALLACVLVEDEPALAGRVRFAGGDALFRINDRLRAPNTSETHEAVRTALGGALAKLYGAAPVSTELRPTSAAAFTVDIRAAGAPDVAELSRRLA